MRALKIDSQKKTVSELEISDEDPLKEMQAVVQGYIEKAYELDNGDTVYVNEEGLYSDPEFFFEIQGAHQPFAGNAIILSHIPRTGESKSAESSVQYIESKVRFLKRRKS